VRKLTKKKKTHTLCGVTKRGRFSEGNRWNKEIRERGTKSGRCNPKTIGRRAAVLRNIADFLTESIKIGEKMVTPEKITRTRRKRGEIVRLQSSSIHGRLTNPRSCGKTEWLWNS